MFSALPCHPHSRPLSLRHLSTNISSRWILKSIACCLSYVTIYSELINLIHITQLTSIYIYIYVYRGGTVVKVLCYKLQIGRSLVRSQLVSVDFSLR